MARGEADYVKGNRLFRGESWQMIPHYRYLGNAVLSLLTKIASGYWHIADSQSGYTAIARIALERLDLDHIYTRYGMPNDLLVKLNVGNFRVHDVSIRRSTTLGKSLASACGKWSRGLPGLPLRGFCWRLTGEIRSARLSSPGVLLLHGPDALSSRSTISDSTSVGTVFFVGMGGGDQRVIGRFLDYFRFTIPVLRHVV